MAIVRPQPYGWEAHAASHHYPRAVSEPRDERAWIPQNAIRTRPAPINFHPNKTHSPRFNTLPASRGPSGRSTPRTPEIVDIATPETWPRGGGPQRPPPTRVASPGSMSQYSTAPSEMSFGILDYYTGDPSPLGSPCPCPRPSTPKREVPFVDAAVNQLDFGLVPQPLKVESASPSRARAATTNAITSVKTTPSNTLPDAEHPHAASSSSSAPTTSRPRGHHQHTYSLFPSPTQHRTPSRTVIPLNDINTTPPSLPSPSPAHTPPHSATRPRNASLTNSLRSRKDSLTSFRATTRKLPLRLLSSASSSTPGTAVTTITTTTPPRTSRWSTSTIASPSPTLTASTPAGGRTSFGSLLGSSARESSQYPDCFFEDDDESDDEEDAPLKRKFGWSKRSGSLTVQMRGRQGAAVPPAQGPVAETVEPGEDVGVGSGARGSRRKRKGAWFCGGCFGR